MTTTVVVRIVGCIVVSYLVGGVPWALIIGTSFYKVDVREHGSGNLGATNVMRVLGWKAALVTFFLDAGKGALAVGIAALAVTTAQFGDLAHESAMIAATLAVMAGHSYSPYIGFRGGKSVATAGGALLVLVPLVWPVLLLTWAVVFLASRIVALGSVVIAALFPILVAYVYRGDWLLLALALVASGLVIFRHSSNIARMLRGEEPTISLTRNISAPEKGRSH